MQYTIHDSRSKNDTLNLGETFGNVAVGWMKKETSIAVRPDPRYLSFEMCVGGRNPDYSTNKVK